MTPVSHPPYALRLTASSESRVRILLWTALALLALASSIFLTRNVDLSVYWYAVNDFFRGARPAYGPNSGIGYPMEYRYPPATYLLLYPLKYFSVRVAGVLWMLGAWATAMASVSIAIRFRGLRFSRPAILASCGFLLAYVVLAVRYGNVQPFVIAWLLAALALSETHPKWSGALLALAVTFKIWPIMFLPWFFRKSRRSALFPFAIALLVLWLFPIAIFGVTGYRLLLQDWYAAVHRMGTTYSEFYYFPSQSLRGLLLRYLTPVAPPMPTFPRINLFSLAPRTAVVIWGITAIFAYSILVVTMLRSHPSKQWAWDGAAFVIYSLLEPYAVKSGLISLGPAILIAASLYTLTARTKIAQWANTLFLAACLISFGQAILQYKPWQRVLLTIGLDFWTEILLLAAFLLWVRALPHLNQIRSNAL